MKKLEISGATGISRLLVGESLSALPGAVPGGRAIIITDDIVWKLYGEGFPDWPVIRIGTGEGIKTLDTAERIYRRLVKLEADGNVTQTLIDWGHAKPKAPKVSEAEKPAPAGK